MQHRAEKVQRPTGKGGQQSEQRTGGTAEKKPGEDPAQGGEDRQPEGRLQAQAQQLPQHLQGRGHQNRQSDHAVQQLP